MASLQRYPSGLYHISFRYQNRRIKRSLDTSNAREASARHALIEETIRFLESGRLEAPTEVDSIEFILSGGKLKRSAKPLATNTPLPSLTLRRLFEQFFGSIPDGNLEQNTLNTMHLHKRHLLRIMGPAFPVQKLTGQDLQHYVNTRATESTQFQAESSKSRKNATRTKVTAATIKKELVTLGTAWRWALTVPLVTGIFPRKGIRLPKTHEKPPFQTRDEIERQIQQEQLTNRESALLWDCLYLRRS
ncbi:MAG: hypothetical protein OES09_17750, partial [Gammaproteobacteria bacterium]|nr:hypothetical protein [Gammaproteobacteria bacterium]